MSGTVYTKLDPYLETLGLLMAGCRFDKTRMELCKAVSEYGIDGESFYDKHLKVYDRYVRTFMKHMSISPEDTYLYDTDDPYYLTFLLALLEGHREYIPSLDTFQDKEIGKAIIDVCRILFKPGVSGKEAGMMDNIIPFLDNTPLSENAKWKIVRIMQSPKNQLQRLVNTLSGNLEAFEKAEIEVKKPLERLINQYAASVGSEKAELFHKFRNSVSDKSDIYPTLAFALSQIMTEKSCYYGLLSHLLLKNGETQNQSKETLLIRLKALSDKSKLEILASLKESPKYNLEIASQMGLTAATMSYHMNVLLSCGFVGVEKLDGRVYYHLEEAEIKQFIGSLEKILLK